MSDNLDQVDLNYEAFIARLPEILPLHQGEYALLHDRGIVTYCSSALAAMMEGARRFADGQYSVQEVTAGCDNLGFYSYAGGSGQA